MTKPMDVQRQCTQAEVDDRQKKEYYSRWTHDKKFGKFKQNKEILHIL